MSTLSVPLADGQRALLKMYVKQGVAASEAELARHAIQTYLEEQAVAMVLRAQKEPSLKGNLDKLVKKL
ncbi:hypothetical protein COT40_00070 [Candidatus Peregrinibacteria bacterium CG08_land_8_20_14_0_20_41_10]|nr:MAG: hypothetical protein COT40_00070 [Candidatus Peregrinibacteria bacterium CG08_land_8_20_14_0_20_41_10]